MNLLNEFLKFNRKHGLFGKGERIAVAVSGGVDSVVLLDLFHRISAEWALELFVIHFNHKLRGRDADEDQVFVQKLCTRLKLPFFCKGEDVKAFAGLHRLSLETAARTCRYRFFDEMIETTGADRLALGHNADDQAETVLHHLIRGSGVKGLAGIPISRGKYIRPLLFAPRQAIEEYAAEKGLLYRTDASNQDTRFRRNLIRHELLPLLKKDFNPNVTKTLVRVAENLAETDRYLEREAEIAFADLVKREEPDKIVLDISKYFTYFKALQKYILRLCLEKLGAHPQRLNYETFGRIEALLESRRTGTSLKIDDTIHLLKTTSELVIGKPEPNREPVIIDKIPGQYTLWDGLIFEIKREIKPLEQVLEPGTRNEEWIDEDSLSWPLMIRTFRPGDRFQPLNSTGHKKLSDFFIDEKVPVYRRKSVPLLVCPKGIVWVIGYRLDDRFKIKPNTTSTLKLLLRSET